eukprot:362375-Chlamydomonas_euryale.AAC.1
MAPRRRHAQGSARVGDQVQGTTPAATTTGVVCMPVRWGAHPSATTGVQHVPVTEGCQPPPPADTSARPHLCIHSRRTPVRGVQRRSLPRSMPLPLHTSVSMADWTPLMQLVRSRMALIRSSVSVTRH